MTFPRIISGNNMKLINTPHILIKQLFTVTTTIVPTDNLITAIEFFNNKTKTRNHGY
jgi:hypothetical protein